MAVVSMKALLETGVHFGHRTRRWNPKMKPYIFTERNGIHILDLQQTLVLIEDAYNLVRDTVAEGGEVLFVGTKRQAVDTIATEASRAHQPYVNERWLGGTLTNWKTISERISYLEKLEQRRDAGLPQEQHRRRGVVRPPTGTYDPHGPGESEQRSSPECGAGGSGGCPGRVSDRPGIAQDQRQSGALGKSTDHLDDHPIGPRAEDAVSDARSLR